MSLVVRVLFMTWSLRVKVREREREEIREDLDLGEHVQAAGRLVKSNGPSRLVNAMDKGKPCSNLGQRTNGTF